MSELNPTLEEKIAVMQAAKDGQPIQVLLRNSRVWIACDNPNWDWLNHEYRVKPDEPRRFWIAIHGNKPLFYELFDNRTEAEFRRPVSEIVEVIEVLKHRQ